MKRSMVADPQEIRRQLRDKSGRQRLLGLDLGTNCGVAIYDFTPLPSPPGFSDVLTVLGQWDLSIGSYDSGPIRHVRLLQFLEETQPDAVFYELVKFTPPVSMLEKVGRNISAIVALANSGSEFLGALKTTVTTWAEINKVPAEGVTIQDIKKLATGKGNANKMDVIRALNARLGTDFATDGELAEKACLDAGIDNIADAAFAGLFGLYNYADGLKYLSETA